MCRLSHVPELSDVEYFFQQVGYVYNNVLFHLNDITQFLKF